MTDQPKYLKFTSVSQANEFGMDPDHLAQHMVETVLCAFNGNMDGLDLGFYFAFRDTANRSWTLSVVPEDGGVISEALLDEAMEER